MGLDYKSSGVDIEAGYESVSLIKDHVKNTFSKNVLTDLGGFGGLFSIAMAKDMKDPVLVSGTDGVGTKLKIAFLLNKHDTIGIDCVAMCVNDIICSGATPLFFLDYLACGKNIPEKIEQIVKGVADGCLQSNISLIGGETAEMPDFYEKNEYDIAGFAVGIVDREKIIDGSNIKEGDILIGLQSNGVHSNGFSLVRRALRPSELNINEHIIKIQTSLGEELIKPTRIYVKPILELIEKINVKGICHITGGGFYENIPRILPKGLGAEIKEDSFEILPVFDLISDHGDVKKEDMFNTFNMGIGMVVVVSENDKNETLEILESLGETVFPIGKVVKGTGITLC